MKLFGTDGIRGRANGVITPELALRVGQAVGLMLPHVVRFNGEVCGSAYATLLADVGISATAATSCSNSLSGERCAKPR